MYVHDDAASERVGEIKNRRKKMGSSRGFFFTIVSAVDKKGQENLPISQVGSLIWAQNCKLDENLKQARDHH